MKAFHRRFILWLCSGCRHDSSRRSGRGANSDRVGKCGSTDSWGGEEYDSIGRGKPGELLEMQQTLRSMDSRDRRRAYNNTGRKKQKKNKWSHHQKKDDLKQTEVLA
jgi:hypothetical protein